MGPSHCYMDDWFEIVCKGSVAFLKRINMEVLEITIKGRGLNAGNTVRVKSSIISSNPSCTSMSSGGGVNLTGSPFSFSPTGFGGNVFISVGCNNFAIMTKTDPMVIGCKSNCDRGLINDEGYKCSGHSCWQTTIPSELQLFDVSFLSSGDNCTKRIIDDKIGQEGCKYAFLVEEEWLLNSNISLPFSVEKMDFIPVVVLDWQIYN
jgi:hypothetical protein